MTEDVTQVHLSGRQIRVLAHPLRVQLLGRLRAEGPATATRLAELLGTNTGATSYHLRRLAEVGLVVEEERPGTGRRRFWRAEHDMSSWRRSNFAGDPDATAAVEWMEAFQVNRFVELAGEWRRGVADEPAEWRDSGELSDYFMELTPEQLRTLMAEIEEVVMRHGLAGRTDPQPGARPVSLYLAALPRRRDAVTPTEEGDR
ncbi:ArsR/SmtB family transcription factor [Actinoplanes rectilineatus]|uniref:ArsR/SmtB family transcription factor n=1 Tax=Actinoplanes rectilineatus TaxID=113571 RepID=UPI0005F2955D|nr:helix-turn-helix domain-containing protein [Actinoplanes rectilineatus]